MRGSLYTCLRWGIGSDRSVNSAWTIRPALCLDLQNITRSSARSHVLKSTQSKPGMTSRSMNMLDAMTRAVCSALVKVRDSSPSPAGVCMLEIRDLEPSLETSPILAQELMPMAYQLHRWSCSGRAVLRKCRRHVRWQGVRLDVSNRSSPKLIQMAISHVT